MNELLNHLNNYAKKRKNKHRFSAVMVCLAVIVSFTVYIGLIEPAESASGQLACGMEEHEHTQDCFELICGFDDESEEEISVDTTEIGSEETTETACETEETTTETTETTTSTEAEETAPVHVHSDKCYRLICLTEAHLHKQDCYNQPVETTEPAATTETSASISTGTTMSTEQTTKTTTTTTKLSEEVYELNAALFGELYMGRVSVLADAQSITKYDENGNATTYPYYYIDEYKFYYENGELYYNEEYFEVNTAPAHHPACNTTFLNAGINYNGTIYNTVYTMDKPAADRYISFNVPDNAPGNGKLIFVLNSGAYTINLSVNGNEGQDLVFTDTGKPNIIEISVAKGNIYKIARVDGKPRLAYAEFIPVPQAGKVYRIIDDNGKYVELSGTNIELGGNTPSGDLSNDFKMEDAGDGYFYIYPQSINDKVIDYEVNNYNIHIYSYNGNNNQKFQFILNDDGTYKIKSPNYADSYWKVDENDDIKTASSAEASNFRIVEATEIVYPKADIDTTKTYLIRNVNSRKYLHRDVYAKDNNGNIKKDADGNPIVENPNSIELVQQKDTSIYSQFKFISTGTDGEYYIVSADGNYALTTNWNVQNGADVRYESFDNSIYSKDQIFHAEQMENGSIRFYQIDNNGKKFYLEIEGEAINDGAEVDLGEADKVKDNQCFFLVPVVAPEEVPEANTRVEARVIFADYNDGKIDENTRNLYDEPAWIPTFSLYKNGNLEENKDGNLVVDVSSARKDWCYQYNYVWNLGTDTTNEYTVKLNGVNSGNKITLNGKEFKVYYLKDTELNHPGNNGNSNAPAEAYKQTPYSQAGDQIIYIFLDPVVEEWWPNGNQPGTFDLSMKKRWDGHNASGFKNRPKEKIKIQLQRLIDNQWVEYNSENFPDDNYDFSCYFEVVDANGENKMYVDKAAVDNATDIYRVLNNDGTVSHYEVRNGATTTRYEKEYFDYETLSSKGWLTDNNNYRFNLHLEEREWNNVVLTVDGNNNPTHFTNGYYFNWKALPYGNYRVIETMSFYDANENDVFDEGDRDTSNEYYYMSYPPMRDSRGVLHIQNFTKDMVLDIHKEWYDDQGTVKLDNPGKTVKVNIYRSLKKKNNPAANDSELELVYPDVDVLNDNIILKTTDGYDKLLLKTVNEQKYYYYIQEVSVDGYLLLNGNDEGFVKSTNGNYYVDYEDGDGRKFIIENKAKVGIKLEKEWYTDKNSNSKMTFAEGSEPNAEFEIYKGSFMGTPTKTGDDYSVNNTKLEKIADAKIDKNGQLEIIGGDINDGNGTSKVISNELHIYGTEEVFNGVTTTNSGGVFEDGGLENDTENKYYTFGGNRLYVKPPSNYGGVLELTFTEISDTDEVRWRNQKTGEVGDEEDVVSKLSAHKDYKTGEDLTISISMNPSDNKSLRKEKGNPKLKSAVFYPYNYYYIREKTSDTCELINGDSNGFVVLQDTNKYYLNLSADSDETRFPIVTAKNIPKVNLNITKEWTPSNAEISKEMDFEIYKAYAQGTPVTDGEGYKVTVNNADYQLTELSGEYITDENGNLNIPDLPAFEEKDGTYHKLYYYVREIEGNYTTSDAINGFIPYESGQYGTAFDDTSSNSGKYNFVNTPKLEITVNKTWLDADGDTDYNNSSREMKFILYRTTNDSFNPETDYRVGEYETKNLTKLIQNLDAYDSSGKKYNYYIVEISSDGNYSVDNYIVTYSETNVSWNKDGKQPVINVTNQAKPQNYELPETGGIGTLGYTVTGGAIILLSAMILLFKRRTQL